MLRDKIVLFIGSIVKVQRLYKGWKIAQEAMILEIT